MAEATAPKGDELEAPKGDELEAPKTHMQSKSLFGPTKPETTLLDSNLLRAFNARFHSSIYLYNKHGAGLGAFGFAATPVQLRSRPGTP